MDVKGTSLQLAPAELPGELTREDAPAPMDGAVWYQAQHAGDGLVYRFPAGALVGKRYLTADMLADGTETVVFQLALLEGEGGPAFWISFAILNQCSARMRLPLEAVNMNRWGLGREGAWLKACCGGVRVDLRKVDRIQLTWTRPALEAARWCMTPVTATPDEPERLADPLLPRGALVDDLGQNAPRDWPEKTRSVEEVKSRLQTQFAEAPTWRWPEGFSRWGGWKDKQFGGTGFFRTHHDGRRWWLVDPDGCAFWSAGLDCVRTDTPNAYRGLEKALSWMPDPAGEFAAMYREEIGRAEVINYLVGNFIRTFGPDEWFDRWSRIALGFCRRFGFNTVANWSLWQIARDAAFPYVRPMRPGFRRTATVYRDFPDVFAPPFAADAADYAEQLRETADDPAFIGYFLMNEPSWGFSSETPAAGMLFNTPKCETRKALGEFLRRKYGDDASLRAAWKIDTTLAAVGEGPWDQGLTEPAAADLAAFSEVMVEKLFGGLSDACRRVDPNHLNLGVRYQSVPPAWAIAGMRGFDVFSVNCYQHRVLPEYEQISAEVNLPILVGEWHFGALDAGPSTAGICTVRTQADRGRAFRVYTEDAAAKPWCVGVHYFTLYDEGTIGRSDGENWNIGFLDVCHRPYAALADAARASHERLYPVALGEAEPYDDPPEYLPRHFF